MLIIYYLCMLLVKLQFTNHVFEILFICDLDKGTHCFLSFILVGET